MVKCSNPDFITCFFASCILILFSCRSGSHKSSDQNVSPVSTDYISLRNHYKGQPAKIRAVEFLCANIPGLQSMKPDGTVIDNESTITNENLIRNIDAAFLSSQNLLKSHLISEHDFFEYVLPYRVNNNDQHTWRQQVWQRYKRMTICPIPSAQSVIDSMNILNKGLSKWFAYGSFDGLEDTASYSTLLNKKKGSCVSMTNMALYDFRALGVPVATDYIIGWGNLNSSHAWNVLLLNNKSLPFMGTEEYINQFDPFSLVEYLKDEQLSTFKKTAKVYRHVFSLQKRSLAYKYRDKDILPPYLDDDRSIDVTAAYMPTMNLDVPDTIGGKPKILYLCNYNSGDWLPVMGAERDEHGYTFKDIGKDLLYCAATYDQGQVQLASHPFYLSKDNEQITLKADYAVRSDITIKSVKSIEYDQLQVFATGSDFKNKKGKSYLRLMAIAEGKQRSQAQPGATYSLFCWNKGWKFLNTRTVKNKTLIFMKMPTNGLYILSGNSDGPDKTDRPFMITNNGMKWL